MGGGLQNKLQSPRVWAGLGGMYLSGQYTFQAFVECNVGVWSALIYTVIFQTAAFFAERDILRRKATHWHYVLAFADVLVNIGSLYILLGAVDLSTVSIAVMVYTSFGIGYVAQRFWGSILAGIIIAIIPDLMFNE